LIFVEIARIEREECKTGMPVCLESSYKHSQGYPWRGYPGDSGICDIVKKDMKNILDVENDAKNLREMLSSFIREEKRVIFVSINGS